MRVEIIVPESAMPKKDPENPCPCQDRPFKLKDKKGELFWIAQLGATVEKGEVICEGEVEKKTIEFIAPEAGVLAEVLVADEGTFKAGDVLGYIEV